MRREFLKHADWNVIVVDWAGGSLPLYTQATANTRLVGLEVAYFINYLKVPPQTRIIYWFVSNFTNFRHSAGQPWFESQRRSYNRTQPRSTHCRLCWRTYRQNRKNHWFRSGRTVLSRDAWTNSFRSKRRWSRGCHPHRRFFDISIRFVPSISPYYLTFWKNFLVLMPLTKIHSDVFVFRHQLKNLKRNS